jgi:hypothetical protein
VPERLKAMRRSRHGRPLEARAVRVCSCKRDKWVERGPNDREGSLASLAIMRKIAIARSRARLMTVKLRPRIHLSMSGIAILCMTASRTGDG